MGLLTLLNQPTPPPPPERAYRRNLEEPLRAALADTPVVVINGARQTGKSTLAGKLMRHGYHAQYVTLDDASALAAARSDPEGFLSAFNGAVVIDEVQRAPGLFPAIKAAVDRRRLPGMFLLTGSAAVLFVPSISESLAGRAEVLTLWPLSQGELEDRREQFVDKIFASQLPLLNERSDVGADVINRAMRGGYPEVIARTKPDRRAAWFRSYVTTILDRDVRELSHIERLTEIPSLLSLLAARATSLLNMAELSRASGIAHRTLIRYVTLLETIFFIRRIPAWSGSLGKRLVRHPKVVLADTGLLTYLQGVDQGRFLNDPGLRGPLLENFVAMELHKQIGWSSASPVLYHYRSHAAEEVDLILERRDGRLVGIEVKASSTVDSHDFRGLRAFARSKPKKFLRGIVLYTGPRTVPFGKDFFAMPISALWKL